MVSDDVFFFSIFEEDMLQKNFEDDARKDDRAESVPGSLSGPVFMIERDFSFKWRKSSRLFNEGNVFSIRIRSLGETVDRSS
ncbi:unnamed protein product [Victoria cruziana]